MSVRSYGLRWCGLGGGPGSAGAGAVENGIDVDGSGGAPPADPVAARGQARKRGRWTVRLADDPEPRFALDLSQGGLFLSGIDRPPGSRIVLTVVLAATSLEVTATVRWSRQGRLVPRVLRGVGIAFDGLDDHARTALAAELEATS